MKTIGLIGGMSWESTPSYYQEINRGVARALGGLHSAKIVMVSVDFAEIEALQMRGEWQQLGTILAKAAESLEAAGVDFILICTNTMHKVATVVEAATKLPLLHIADATAEQLLRDGISKVGLLGTAFTMEQEFYKSRLSDQYAVEVVIPKASQRKDVHDIIYSELCMGEVNLKSKQRYIEVVNDLAELGAQAVILGCTEISLLLQQSDTKVRLYDTTAIHAAAAVKRAVST